MGGGAGYFGATATVAAATSALGASSAVSMGGAG